MARYKAVGEIEATQWYRNGDHPKDDCTVIKLNDKFIKTEGKIVRYFRHPQFPGESICQECHLMMSEHGWIDQPEEYGQSRVCPGDYVIDLVTGYYVVSSPQVFLRLMERVPEKQQIVSFVIWEQMGVPIAYYNGKLIQGSKNDT
jgi:hypothetical protein